eukprot:GEMP01015021.1.p1 GENE.GEMP01015021.1~~GEMP01015021.1.p1  ORF type:complete len:192 (-),score=20.55 GEMP01015021.1:2389-2934(-)
MAHSENLAPKIALQLFTQVSQLTKDAPEGITVMQCDDDITKIYSRIEGPPSTPYEGATFQLFLVVPPNFPQSPPKAFFQTKIFHPNVSATGEVCVNTLKRDWDSQKWSIRHILQVIRCLLIEPFPESALNQEAGKLFMESYDDFARQASLMAQVHAPTVAPMASRNELAKPKAKKKVLRRI